MHCPSIESQIKDRTCEKCSLYFASKKAVATHLKKYHKKNDSMTCSRIRPVNIIDRRNHEALCIIRTDENSEDAEWIDIDDIEPEIISDLETSTSDHDENESGSVEELNKSSNQHKPFPIIENLSDWITSPWEQE